MNFQQALHHLLQILGIASGNDTTTTALTTPTFGSSSTPMILDTSSFIKYQTTERSTISPKFLSSLATGSPYESSTDRSEVTGPPVIVSKEPGSSTSVKEPGTSTSVKEPGTSTSEKEPGTSTSVKEPGTSTTEKAGSSTTEKDSSSSTTEKQPGSSTTTQEPTTSTTESKSTGSSITASPKTETTSTATESTASETSTSTGNESTVTDTETPTTGNETTVTGSESTVTGSESTVPGSESTVTGTGSTAVSPTDKPHLSRGAVAGIVIGCLLVVALITAAVVFVMKQRANPEARRLNV